MILTLNESLNIGDCLDSLRQLFSDIHIVDSGSSDATVATALAAGAQVSTNPFLGFGAQRNWAHDHAPLQHDWVLHLDADERMTDALGAEIAQAIAQDQGRYAGYFLAEKTILLGQWLRHAGQYPRYQARLVHRGRMRFVEHGHGQREESALPLAHLCEPYLHLAFSHGIEAWLKKHVGYARKEADLALSASFNWGELLSAKNLSTAIARRRTMKATANFVPFRPLLRWMYVMIVCRGVLDGRAGWQYAKMMWVFQSMIDLLVSERQSKGPR